MTSRQMRPDAGIEDYYARRAGEYERIYALPERQADLQRLRETLSAFAAGRRLLEIACGTGYWTGVVAAAARAVVASDAVEEVLKVAREKPLPQERVSFVRADAFDLAAVPGDFDAAFAGFWWSHVPRARLTAFLTGLHLRLGAGKEVLFFDNRFVPGSSTPIARTDDQGDSYQERRLSDGTRHELIKNFPSADEVRAELRRAGGRAIQLQELQHYWIVRYEVGSGVGFDRPRGSASFAALPDPPATDLGSRSPPRARAPRPPGWRGCRCRH
jgi:SAM-dependent methyltransferase